MKLGSEFRNRLEELIREATGGNLDATILEKYMTSDSNPFKKSSAMLHGLQVVLAPDEQAAFVQFIRDMEFVLRRFSFILRLGQNEQHPDESYALNHKIVEMLSVSLKSLRIREQDKDAELVTQILRGQKRAQAIAHGKYVYDKDQHGTREECTMPPFVIKQLATENKPRAAVILIAHIVDSAFYNMVESNPDAMTEFQALFRQSEFETLKTNTAKQLPPLGEELIARAALRSLFVRYGIAYLTMQYDPTLTDNRRGMPSALQQYFETHFGKAQTRIGRGGDVTDGDIIDVTPER